LAAVAIIHARLHFLSKMRFGVLVIWKVAFTFS